MKPTDLSAELPRFAELESEYEILRELGRGGTAVVYLARERELGRTVALKVIRATYIEDAEAAARLMREARTVGALQHPNIVMLYGTRRLVDNSLALIMQYVPGQTLKSEIRAQGPLPSERATQILNDIGHALAHAHRHRIVHRDIKPENVYLDEETGIARLSDFGIARPWDSDSGLTLPGSAIGTPAYMSPEQIDGGELDGRSDIYSLGLVGYEMLTGETPWAGESLFRVIYKQKHEELPPLAERRPDVAAPLLRAIEGALRKEPTARWADAHEFLATLSGAVFEPGAAPPAVLRATARAVATAVEAAPRREPIDENVTIQYRRPGAGEQPATAAAPATPAAAPATPASKRKRGASAAKPKRARGRATAKAKQQAAEGGQAAPGAAAEDGQAAPGAAARDVQAAPGAAAQDGQAAPDRDTAPPAETALSGAASAQTPPPQPAGAGWTPAAQHSLMGFDEPHGARRVPGPAKVPGRRRAMVVAGVLTIMLAGAAAALAISQRGRDDGERTELPPTVLIAEPPPPVAGVPAYGFALQGAVQAGVAGDSLAEPLVVRVEDQAGRPVSNAVVRFAVTLGDGRVLPDSAVTDEYGAAQAVYLPLEPGRHTVEASFAGANSSTVFEAQVASRAAARLAATSPSTIRGEAGARAPLVVRVDDDRGNPVAGVQVRFLVSSGAGRLAQEVGVTGPDGTARTEWVLGTGPQEAVASVDAVPGMTVQFRAEGGAPALRIRPGLTTGGTHSCAVGGDGSVACWGGNHNGQLGDGSASRRTSAVRVAAPEPFATLAAGVSHTCGVSATGAAYCWGANTAGQVGDGTRNSRPAPTRVALDRRLVSVEAGEGHSCGLDAAGVLYCWGQNSSGQLGDGTRTDRATPVIGGGRRSFRTVALGWAHTCGLTTAGDAVCWGRNGSGELGDGTSADRTQPVRVAGGHRFTALAAGSAHTCGLSADGRILCWGRNLNGQLGVGGAANSLVPVAVETDQTFSAVAVGGVHSCGLTRDGTAWCWGRNTYGQLGDGSTDDQPRPVAVDGGLRFATLSANGAHTCGTTAAGQRYCWGFNADGQLGDGSRTNQPRPVAANR